MDSADGDWSTQLQPDRRQHSLDRILEAFERKNLVSDPDELKKIAQNIEERIYSGSTSPADYLRKINMKMVRIETICPKGVNNSIPSNSSGNQNPPDPASQGLHSQLRNPGQSLPVPVGSQSQSSQQLGLQNLQNTIASGSVQSSSGLQTALSSASGLNQTAMSNVVGQNSNLPTMSGISQNSVNNSVGQAVPSNIFSNSQRQTQGRQHSQQVLSQQQQEQLQNPQQLYQHHMMNQKLQPGNMQPALLQSHMQQHPSLLHPNQIQPSQQSLLQMSSALQSGQATFQQQPSMLQSTQQASLQQNHLQHNQQSSVQQPVPSGLQQHQQSILRQQHPQKPSIQQQTSVLQQQTTINQQTKLPSQQQQQLMTQQPSATNMQQNQLLAQQNSVLDMKHQQHQQQMILSQQNNLSNVQQQQLFSQQSKNLHQQQQLSQHSNFSGGQQQLYILQQTKGAMQQQQSQQTSSTLLPSQGQQSQSQQPQQILSQSQPVQSQQHQHQQPHILQREMHQRIQTSALLDSTAQAGHADVIDWQEEIYQKIKSMKESYLPDLNELNQKIAMKCQQIEALSQHPKHSDAIEKFKSYKMVLERTITFLQVPKSSISPAYREMLSQAEKYISNFLAPNRKKTASSQQPGQQQLQQSVGQSHLFMQQPQTQIQIPQLQQQENYVNTMQPVSMQGLVTSIQSTAVSSLQHGSMSISTYMGVPATQQNMMNSLQTNSNFESALGHTFRSLPQSVVGSLQQNTINASQKTNISTLSHSSMNQLQPSVNSLPPNSSMLQQQHLKQQQQDQQLIQSQQLKQYQQRNLLQQFIHQQQKQHMLQRQHQPQMQQLHQQQKQQQPSQLQAQQIAQLHQMNEMNELKAMRPGAGIKSELFPLPHHAGQRQTTYQQQLKAGSSFSVSSPQPLQAASPQLSQHSSPLIDQQNLHTAIPKVGTPLQCTSSPLIGNSPSAPAAPSPIPGDPEKQPPAISSIPNAGNIGHEQISHVPTQAQYLSIETPGISASPLLAEFTSLDGNQGSVPSNLSGKSSTMEQPLERLIKVVRSMSPKAFRSSVIDIDSVVSMIDMIAGSAPGNGSRAAAGEDLVAMAKCRLQARNFVSHDGSCTTKKKRLRARVMPSNPVSSAGSANDSLEQSIDFYYSELESSTATTRIKRHRAEANHALLQEVREINQRLIDTAIEIGHVDADSITAAAEGEGTIVKCSFNAVAASPDLKSQFGSAQIFPILLLWLLVPSSYPNCSPILLDKLPAAPSKEFEDLCVRARLRFSISLRGLLQPISLEEMARTWDNCARMVIVEFAQQIGGGTFSSRNNGLFDT